MTKTNQDVVMWDGADKRLTFTISGITTGTYIWKLYAYDVNGTVVLTKTGSVTSGAATVTLTPANTTGLEGVYYHEMQCVDGSSNTETTSIGTLTINKAAI